jgi:hypothetical protein
VKELAVPAIKSLEDEEGLRCVDIIERDEGTYTFKEFRKDSGRHGAVASRQGFFFINVCQLG